MPEFHFCCTLRRGVSYACMSQHEAHEGRGETTKESKPFLPLKFWITGTPDEDCSKTRNSTHCPPTQFRVLTISRNKALGKWFLSGVATDIPLTFDRRVRGIVLPSAAVSFHISRSLSAPASARRAYEQRLREREKGQSQHTAAFPSPSLSLLLSV